MPNLIKLVVILALVIAVPISILAAQRSQNLETQAETVELALQATPPARTTTKPSTPASTVTPNNYEGCEGKELAVGGEMGVSIENPLCLSANYGGATSLIGYVIRLLLIASTIITFVMLVWGAIRYITAAGDSKNTQAARSRITYALIGFVLSFISLLLISFLGQIVGFNLFPTGRTDWNKAVGEAVKQEQRRMSNDCREALDTSKLPGLNYQQCLNQYCRNTYPASDRKQTDCIQLSRGVFDDALKKELKGIQDFCSNEDNQQRIGYDGCINAKCNSTYGQNSQNAKQCTKFLNE